MALKQQHTLLLVDDERSITKALHRLFRKDGYHILTADSGESGLAILSQTDKDVSLIISDQRMPEMNGAQFLEQAKELFPDAIRYLLTGYSDMEAVIAAVNKGEIHRYLTKPWNDEDLLLQVRQSLEQYELLAENRRLTELTVQQNTQLNQMNKALEKKVADRTREIQEKNKALVAVNQMLENSFMDAIRLLSSTVEVINPKLGQHMRKVAQWSRQVAAEMGLDGSQLDQIEMAGMIHDIGLLGLPETLWEKEPGNMKADEFRAFSQHPVVASICLESVEKLADVGEIVLFHHEYVNGKGFPNGLLGNQIPMGARILLTTSDYIKIVDGWPRDMQKLISMTRRHFDAAVWKTFTVSDDPETIIAEAAEKHLLMNVNRKYDMDVITALLKIARKSRNVAPTFSINLDELEAGMVLMEDMRLKDGRLLLTRGTKLKASSVQSIQAIGQRGMIDNNLIVSIPGNETAATG